ncbi:pyrroloquinoline quinone biosynthesis protein PqqB [Falsirhodobacter deserti]|uniref:pyrroloquinoline quinone biosynthesis protein PqqB n=1 Tax=Falsirhodobacter deserti TaxID=1365611 RepID=UPI001F4D914D|nr:pyrroloquinoline quinone biosynthesis protein PqqB [Falsirhodobacter deserti]
MNILILGTAAGGGLPQWNCGCGNCSAARAGHIPSMTQSSLAVEVGEEWVVLNASPDIRAQLAQTPALHPRTHRGSPIRAVVVTNGDVDHIAGLLTLRESTPFTLHATAATHRTLDANPIFGVLNPVFVDRAVQQLEQPFAPVDGLEVTAFAVPGKVPLYQEEAEVDTRLLGEQTVGLRLAAHGRVAYYIPGCAAVPPDLLHRLRDADVLFFDGTVWENDEMQRTGTGHKTGARMGHMAMNGSQGSIAALASLTCRKIFVHINNTNPVLQPGPERDALVAAGWELGFDGMDLTA